MTFRTYPWCIPGGEYTMQEALRLIYWTMVSPILWDRSARRTAFANTIAQGESWLPWAARHHRRGSWLDQCTEFAAAIITSATWRGFVHMMTWLPSSSVMRAFMPVAMAFCTAGGIAPSAFVKTNQLGFDS
jgi:hypothetical protein